jgi:signal transduction histidine kinase
MFLYMVIHDLKHPTEALISQLKVYRKFLRDQTQAFKRFLATFMKDESIFEDENSEDLDPDQTQENYTAPSLDHSSMNSNFNAIRNRSQETLVNKQEQVIMSLNNCLHSELDSFRSDWRHGQDKESLRLIVDIKHGIKSQVQSIRNPTDAPHCQQMEKFKMEESTRQRRDKEKIVKFMTKSIGAFEVRHHQVEGMVYNSELMRNLLMDLLDLAQLKNDRFSLNKQYFSLESVIDRAITVVQHAAQYKNVELIS